MHGRIFLRSSGARCHGNGINAQQQIKRQSLAMLDRFVVGKGGPDALIVAALGNMDMHDAEGEVKFIAKQGATVTPGPAGRRKFNGTNSTDTTDEDTHKQTERIRMTATLK